MLWLKFALTQLVNIPLAVLGLPICAALSALDCVKTVKSPVTGKMIGVWPRPFWIWSNDEHGVDPPGHDTRWGMFVWTALRNPVDNLKYAPGVATPGGPLLYHTWTWFGKQFYYKVGYMVNEGHPAFQPIGAGRGY